MPLTQRYSKSSADLLRQRNLVRVEDYKRQWEETKRTFESMITFKRTGPQLIRDSLSPEIKEVVVEKMRQFGKIIADFRKSSEANSNYLLIKSELDRTKGASEKALKALNLKIP